MKSLPAWSERLLRALCPDELYEQIEGDLIDIQLRGKDNREAKSEAAFYPAMFWFFQARDCVEK
ncbi:hypothetical protein [Chryseolinea sp. H1M3-3]|uniref:hypothetical protein n=1 Tax=Chryseolinea sp. H1M3-3 TaxID=3034144 RepID=UPI0023EBEF0C|nr:hypothetical protein [Chryseolinea sp. H1M3-3]